MNIKIELPWKQPQPWNRLLVHWPKKLKLCTHFTKYAVLNINKYISSLNTQYWQKITFFLPATIKIWRRDIDIMLQLQCDVTDCHLNSHKTFPQTWMHSRRMYTNLMNGTRCQYWVVSFQPIFPQRRLPLECLPLDRRCLPPKCLQRGVYLKNARASVSVQCVSFQPSRRGIMALRRTMGWTWLSGRNMRPDRKWHHIPHEQIDMSKNITFSTTSWVGGNVLISLAQKEPSTNQFKSTKDSPLLTLKYIRGQFTLVAIFFCPRQIPWLSHQSVQSSNKKHNLTYFLYFSVIMQ